MTEAEGNVNILTVCSAVIELWGKGRESHIFLCFRISAYKGFSIVSTFDSDTKSKEHRTKTQPDENHINADKDPS